MGCNFENRTLELWKMDLRFVEIQIFHCSKIGVSCAKIRKFTHWEIDRNCSKLDVRFAEILNFHCMKFGASLIKIRMFGYREIGRFCRSPKPLLFENWSQLYQNAKVRPLGNWILIVGNWTCVLPKS